MNIKHKTFAEYDDELTHACKSTLGTLGRRQREVLRPSSVN